MADCSKTEVFLKEWNRMCDSSQDTCQQCYLYEMVNIGSSCHAAMRANPKQVIDAVQKWSNEHPSHSLPKTRQSEFLKIFPAALMTNNVIDIMPCEIIDEELEKCSGNCAVCRKKFWLVEVE
nr:MAG TPA: hypothetical protein [Caudoviricetes sp.]